jgi:predicted nucleic acid-binding protein
LSTYADTSFLVSLYVFDSNSVRAAATLANLPRPILLTPLLQVEISNAFQLRVFRKDSTADKIKASSDLFGRDVRAGMFELKSLGSEVFRQASDNAKRRTAILGTRTLDLLHVATAIFLQADVFCTFDRNQTKLASAEGLKVVIP